MATDATVPVLSRYSVFCDFDGTITAVDVAHHLLNRLATPDWRTVDHEFVAGRLSSRECLLALWDELPHDEAVLRAEASTVPLDAGFERLVTVLHGAGAELTVVSDGFGFCVDDVCAPYGVSVVTNAVDWRTGRLEFPNEDRCCPCTSCGTCKQAPIREAASRGRTTVVIGDGASDRKAALLADVIYAKDGLALWCEGFGVPHVPFTTLDDVVEHLDAQRMVA